MKPVALSSLKHALRKKASARRAASYQRFFKTGPGEYGEGDRFIGVTVPELWKLAHRFRTLKSTHVMQLVRASIHEERLPGLMIWVEQYRAGTLRLREQIFRQYVRHFRFINNWDLVDVSAPAIAGHYLHTTHDGILLKRWAVSPHLWTRRIAMVATLYFIRRKDIRRTLEISRLLLADRHDLIHKASGWMLREAAKRDQTAVERFLQKNYTNLPRTTLRYAIERFPDTKRKMYLHGSFRRSH